MRYDFTTLPERHNTGSAKYDLMLRTRPDAAPDAVPFSVADMELNDCPEIIEGLREYLKTAVLGYTVPRPAYYEAVQSWMQRRHGFLPEKDWFVTSPGIVPALYELVNAMTVPGDAVLMLSPVYHPFRLCAQRQRREAVFCPLVERGTTYDIDFTLFEKLCSEPKVKMFLLCSPHNPVGRIWTEEEVVRLADICRKHGVLFVSDEIHADLILPGYTHFSAGRLPEQYRDTLILCTAPTKTFNLAGMQVSNLFIPNKALRGKIGLDKEYGMLGALSYEACRLAYEKGEAWLEELRQVLDANKKLVETFCRQELPEIRPFELMGTYLLWLDCRSLGLSKEQLEKRMVSHDLYFDEGYIFGEEGAGFERMNIACPTDVLRKALARFKEAVTEKYKVNKIQQPRLLFGRRG